MTAKGALVCHKSGESASGLRPPVGSDRKDAHEQPLCWIRQGAREHNLLAGRDVQKVWEAGALCKKSRGEGERKDLRKPRALGSASRPPWGAYAD